jgi:hypothetical protein
MTYARITIATATFLLAATSASASVISVGQSAFGPGSTLLTFDQLANGTVVDGIYAGQGVLFSNTTAVAGAFPVSPPNVIMASDLATPIIIDFPAGILKVGIQIDTDGYVADRQPQIRAFDAQGNLLGTLLFGQGPDFEGFQATSGLIARIEVGACHTFGDSTCSPLAYSDSYDNLIFSNSNSQLDTPEPATAAVMAIGCVALLGLSVRRRRRS